MKVNYLLIGFLLSLSLNSFMYFTYVDGNEKTVEQQNVITKELKMKITESKKGRFSETKLIGKTDKGEIICIVDGDYILADYASKNLYKEIVVFYKESGKDYSLVSWMPVEEKK